MGAPAGFKLVQPQTPPPAAEPQRSMSILDLAPTSTPAPLPPPGISVQAPNARRILTETIAQQYLEEAGGDPEKARAAARADGYDF